MTARVLVVDDVLTNIKLLEARLTAEYFDVLTATNGPQALALCNEGKCDIVLLDVMMPGMDGFEVCRRLKASPHTAHIPVVMVTALDQPADRVKGLDAGADDLLTKPIDEMAVLARVRSLSRLKVTLDELRARAATSASLGLADPAADTLADNGAKGKILLVEDRAASAERVVTAMSKHHEIIVEPRPQEALFKAAEGNFDLIIVSLGLENFDCLRLCSQLRSLERTRSLPILTIAEQEDRQKVLRGLDLGVNDYLMRPIDRNELTARVRTQIRRKRYVDQLKDSVQASMELALTDALTGLNNRRFLERHFAALLYEATHKNFPLSLMILDIDHFKLVNDNYGHDAGDEVLKSFAARIKELLMSEKDESELTMCTDVDRNDKSRICVPGSVKVIGRRQIELYSRLIHTVDHVEGTLRPGFDALDAFLTHMWAVTVTGAPKLWAMRWIEDHERTPRAWYGGAIGLVGFDGRMNTGLTLRTVRIVAGVAEVRVGATLLFDSDPSAEEAETELKSATILCRAHKAVLSSFCAAARVSASS